ncbi:radical SAM/SPASM domain-containing protein [Chloroflexota bacterium]
MKHLPVYRYLPRTYLKYLAIGKCLSYPLALHVQTQSYCNARCPFCPHPSISRKLEQGEMEWTVFERIVEQLTPLRSPPRLFFGLHSEPLLDTRILDFVRLVKSKRRDIFCSIVTNGELLDKFDPTDIAESGLNHLSVSLNAHSKETYECLNTGLSYARVMNNVSRVLSSEPLRHRVSLSYVATGQNLDEIRLATAYWRKKGVDTWVAQVANRTGLVDNYEDIRLPSRYYGGNLAFQAWKRMMSWAGLLTGCSIPFHQMNVLFNGDFILCCHDWGRSTVIGNIADASLESIWNSGRTNANRSNLLRKRYNRIAACRDCSLARA